MSIKAIVFDLDGTLIDTAPDFIAVVNQLRAQEGLAPLPDSAIRARVSHGARALITLAFGLEEGEAGFEPLKQRLLTLYEQNLGANSHLFPGMADLLQRLSNEGLQWGIATNKPNRFTGPLIDALGLSPNCVICPDHVANPKPYPDSLILAAELLHCEPHNIVYVGDHQRDIECGQRAGSPTIAAAFGYLDDNDVISEWQANHVIDHADQIWPIIKSLG